VEKPPLGRCGKNENCQEKLVLTAEPPTRKEGNEAKKAHMKRSNPSSFSCRSVGGEGKNKRFKTYSRGKKKAKRGGETIKQKGKILLPRGTPVKERKAMTGNWNRFSQKKGRK